ncbi:unnamed protein product [Adineta ricciae]|uniref:G-protein coupled receptors family 1 profile domain-containing protein n=1 Tax=Adineta ricciae TaxID=249248 RepID=A0A815AVJ4_ADIRI|nr:unnamed protein product [Adineta ricciae]
MSSLGSTFLLIQQQLTRCVYSSYLTFGIIGCILNIILLNRRPFRTMSCCVYFSVGSVPMLISLLFGTLPHLYALSVHSMTFMYRWLLAAACFDRYVLTSTNNRLRNLASVRIAYRVIVINSIIWLVLPIQILILFNVRDNKCGIVYDINAALYFSCYVLIFGCCLPITIMIICAMLIHRNLRLKRQRRLELSLHGHNGEQNAEKKRDQQVFAMLLLQAVVFIVTLTPWTILNFYNALTIYITNKSTDRVAIEQFIAYIAEIIIVFFPATSFYVYTMVSKAFRIELKKLFSHLLLIFKCKRHPNRIHALVNVG